MATKNILGIALGVTALCLLGCSAPKANPNLTAYRMAVTKLAPEPVYNRVRQVLLPEPLPVVIDRSASAVSASLPVMELTVTNEPLRSVAKLIGESAQYSSYCSQKIADRTVTLTAVGDINELASALEQAAGVSVIVDHEQKHVKVLPAKGSRGSGIAPALPQS